MMVNWGEECECVNIGLVISAISDAHTYPIRLDKAQYFQTVCFSL